jgi:hypothetical protein
LLPLINISPNEEHEMKVPFYPVFILVLVLVALTSILFTKGTEHHLEISKSVAIESRVEIKKVKLHQSLTYFQKCESLGFSIRNSSIEVYDGFIFFDEEELLEIRLNELYDTVDYFIVVEGNRNFRGIKKPLLFGSSQHEDRYHKFRDKIVYVLCDLDEFGEITEEKLMQDDLYNSTTQAYRTVWKREAKSRHCILNGFAKSNPNDFILISGNDQYF